MHMYLEISPSGGRWNHSMNWLDQEDKNRKFGDLCNSRV